MTHWRRVALLVSVLILAFALASYTSERAQRTTSYDDLVTLFNDWRAFQKPRFVNGAPDYRAASMAAQHRELTAYQKRLAAIDSSRWPIHQQADYHVVRAEMNGLDFDHRVLKPWANNPAFYVTVFPNESDQPAREGPFAYGAVELWGYRFPLSNQDAATIESGIRIIPALLDQAKTNLLGTGRDLWTFGTASIKQQSANLARLQSQVPETATALKSSVERAKAATDAFAAWLQPRPPRILHRSGLSRSRGHADPWVPLVRQGPHAARAPSKPHPPGPAGLQHLQLAHGGPRDEVGRGDDAGGDVRRPPALARAHLHPGGERAARALGDLRMHSREFTLEQAAAYTPANTPRNWLRLDGRLVRGEQHLYLQQPAYGTSYVIGRIQFERLLATRKRQMGDTFTMKAFMEEFDAAGLIPMSLIEWQLTGELLPDTRRMLTVR